MKPLFEAIYAHYASDPLATRLSELYDTEAPPDAEYPYAVFSVPSDVQEITFSENFENCLIQFNIFSEEAYPDEVYEIFRLLKGDTVLGTGFDFFDLVLDDYTTVSMQRENAILTRLEGKIWLYSVTYRLLLESTGEAARAKIEKYLYNLLPLL